MPELPEVETVRRTIMPWAVGRRVAGVEVRRGDVVVGGKTERALLVGDVIARLVRKGKNLAIVGGSGRAVVVHLGMSGSLVAVAGGREEQGKHEHVVWELREVGEAKRGSRPKAGAYHGTHGEGSRVELVFRDPRRFGGIETFGSEAEMRAAVFDVLGPDALGVTGAHLWGALRRSRRAIKAALLDQRVLAGVGNIYADEALFEAGIEPRRLCTRVSRAEFERLAESVRKVLRAAIRGRGTTISDYRDGEGKAGGYEKRLRVYGRGGKACVRCGGRLRSAVVGQRTTVWCGGCQRRS